MAVCLRLRTCRQASKEEIVRFVIGLLIFGWESSTERVLGASVPAGPVLEVLFLATAVGMREGGQALALVSELEEMAQEAAAKKKEP